MSEMTAKTKNAMHLIHAGAEALIDHAIKLGLVVTIETASREPLAMGHYAMVVTTREARHAAPAAAQPPVLNLPEDVAAIVACLGDDAAALRHETANPEDERAANMDAAASLLESLAKRQHPPAATPFQSRVQPWLLECFGEMIAGDREERNHRFLEEALELVQACGCSASEAHQLVDYVYGRPKGEPAQEVGGVMVTLAALCLANGLEMHHAAEVELARIWTKVEAIRAKQAAKPKHSPLPAAAPAAPPAPEIEEALHEAVAAIYFDDSSKFRSALGCVVRSLDHRLAGKLLCHPKAAYDESLARRDAARAGPDAPAAARVAIQLVGHWDMHGIQPVHWVPGILRGTFADGTPLYAGSLTEDQRKDLLAAAITIAARKDPTCVLSADDEERILGLLSDLAGMALEAAQEAPHA